MTSHSIECAAIGAGGRISDRPIAKKELMKNISIVISLVVVVAFAATSVHAQNLVLNPGFELDGVSLLNQAPLDWGYIYGGYLAVEYMNSHGDVAHTGNFAAWFGSNTGNNDTIYQSIPTVVGGTYNFSFWVDNANSFSATYFIASWGTTNVLQILPSDGTATNGWTLFSFMMTATASNTTISFAGQNAPASVGLDDVSVTPMSFTSELIGVGLNQTNVVLTLLMASNFFYDVQSTTDLVSGTWSTIASNIPGLGVTTNYIDYNGATVPQKFYRVGMHSNAPN